MENENNRDSIEKQLAHLACFIEMENLDGQFSGSGFLFNDLKDEADPKLGSYWFEVNGNYIITNRHVIFGLPEDEKLPSSVGFHIRNVNVETQESHWTRYNFDSGQIKRKTYVHENPDVDIAVVDLAEFTMFSGQFPHVQPITSHSLIENSIFTVECTDEVIVAGFPRGYYDDHSHFPIVKRGIIASAWNAPFGGEPFFLIDSKLFPGSSGSAVLTHPVEQVLADGEIQQLSKKHFALLGVYSGEPYFGHEDDPEYVDVGIVWYSHLIKEITRQKVRWSPESIPTVSLGSMIRPLRKKNVG